jgi:hypothetical protein
MKSNKFFPNVAMDTVNWWEKNAPASASTSGKQNVVGCKKICGTVYIRNRDIKSKIMTDNFVIIRAALTFPTEVIKLPL